MNRECFFSVHISADFRRRDATFCVKISDTHEKVWETLRDFAAGSLTLPVVEERIAKCLKIALQPYVFADWQPAYDAVLHAEDDTIAALDAIDQFRNAFDNHHSQVHATAIAETTQSNTPAFPSPRQLIDTELALGEMITSLVERNGIRGSPLTVEAFINPVEEAHPFEESPFAYTGGDDDIVAEVLREETGVSALGDGKGLGDGNDDGTMEPPEETLISLERGITHCAELERLCLVHAESIDVGGFLSSLRKFRGSLQKKERHGHAQTTLNTFFSTHTS
jgi:hypothetical protein